MLFDDGFVNSYRGFVFVDQLYSRYYDMILKNGQLYQFLASLYSTVQQP